MVFLFFAASVAIHAEDPASSDAFHEKAVYLDLAGGASQPHSSVIKALETGGSAAFIPLLGDLTATAPDRKLYGLYLLSQPTGSARAANGRLGIEYGVNNWFGIGGSFETTQVTLKNVPIVVGALGNFGTLLFLSRNSPASSPNFVDFFLSSRGTVRMSPLNVLNIDFGFHFPSPDFLDPYFKFVYGFGAVDGGFINKAGGILGVRVLIGQHFYFFLEGYGNAMAINFPGDPATGEKPSQTSVNEGGGRFGLGLRFR